MSRRPLSRAMGHAAIVFICTWSTTVVACPSCVDPRDATTNALLGSTVFLSLVPLIFTFGVVAWVMRAERAAVKAQAEADLDVADR